MVVVEIRGDGVEQRQHPQATSYDVSEDGKLVLYAGEKPFAVYNRRHWVAASMNPEDI